MNDPIRLLQNHRSIRKFLTTPIEQEKLDAILHSGQMASTSSNMQAYSVIGVTDAELKKRLALLCGNQAYIEQCPIFLVWCADLHRLSAASEMHGTEAQTDTTEHFIIATVDAALAAQNAAVAAESLGLGIVYIGGIRNRIAEVAELLKLPVLVYPVFGMCVGYPDQTPLMRPRLPLAAIFHQETYHTDNELSAINEYDETTREYMLARSEGRANRSWSEQMAERMASPSRLHMQSFLMKQGFLRK
ncbi:oxygen-insensitive NADPH nitroreductase [Cohnella sp.]|uniref:oxygen-insensitive NADPH nitroreductase n=1 Tax=Cohnella sp. TaxID=1883426 RepID=UPI003564CB01